MGNIVSIVLSISTIFWALIFPSHQVLIHLTKCVYVLVRVLPIIDVLFNYVLYGNWESLRQKHSTLKLSWWWDIFIDLEIV